MSKTCAHGFVVSLAILFLASAVLAQEPEQRTTTPRTDCEPNNCISKVLYLPEFSTAGELQEVANTFRTIVDLRYVYLNQSDHTIALKCFPAQLAVAEKLVSVLESLRSSGGHDRSSVLAYQLKGNLAGTARSEDILSQRPQAISTMCELSTCYYKAMYLPDLSMAELQNSANKLRTTAGLTRVQPMPSRHVLVIACTSEQVVLADRLLMNTSAPQ